MSNWLIPVTALGCGTIGGVFFAFSTFIMKALGKLPAAQGIAAMQSINFVVLNPLFLGVFMGTAALSLAVAIVNLRNTPSAFAITACVLYLTGTFLVTILGNVPMNNRLAALDPHSAAAASYWQEYLVQWTRWNHVRTLAALAACGLFFLR